MLQSRLLVLIGQLLDLSLDSTFLTSRHSPIDRLKGLLQQASSRSKSPSPYVQESLALFAQPEPPLSFRSASSINGLNLPLETALVNYQTLTDKWLLDPANTATLEDLRTFASLGNRQAAVFLLNVGDSETMELTLREFRDVERNDMEQPAFINLCNTKNPDLISMLEEDLYKNQRPLGNLLNLKLTPKEQAHSGFAATIISSIISRNHFPNDDAMHGRMVLVGQLITFPIREWYDANRDALQNGDYANLHPPAIPINYPPWTGEIPNSESLRSAFAVFNQFPDLHRIPPADLVKEVIHSANRDLGNSDALSWRTVHARCRMDLPDFTIQKAFWRSDSPLWFPGCSAQDNAHLWHYRSVWQEFLRQNPRQAFAIMANDAVRADVKTSDLLRLSATINLGSSRFHDRPSTVSPLLKSDWQKLFESKNPCYRLIAFASYDQFDLSSQERQLIYYDALFIGCSYLETQILKHIRADHDYNDELADWVEYYFGTLPLPDDGTQILPDPQISFPDVRTGAKALLTDMNKVLKRKTNPIQF